MARRDRTFVLARLDDRPGRAPGRSERLGERSPRPRASLSVKLKTKVAGSRPDCASPASLSDARPWTAVCERAGALYADESWGAQMGGMPQRWPRPSAPASAVLAFFGKPEVESVLRILVPGARQSRLGYKPGEDFLLDVYVYVSGDVWQHGQFGVRPGNIGRKI